MIYQVTKVVMTFQRVCALPGNGIFSKRRRLAPKRPSSHIHGGATTLSRFQVSYPADA